MQYDQKWILIIIVVVQMIAKNLFLEIYDYTGYP